MKYSVNIKIMNIALLLALMANTAVDAAVHKGDKNAKVDRNEKRFRLDGCDPASSQIDLDVNNVRCRLLNGGDMWWDLFGDTNPRYEIPKVEPGEGRSLHSSFASGLWFGGVDDGGQLKTAGQTYRQNPITGAQENRSDFWPGPLDKTDGSITNTECEKWDKHFSVKRSEIDNLLLTGEISEGIETWPWAGDPTKNQETYLAPFFDADGSGTYNPSLGDYPTLDPAVPEAKPDQLVWWIYNDKGNIHTKYPGAEPIGLEVHALAFAFAAKNEINNMTFYKYTIFNRASLPLKNTYFAIFTDSDLGNPADDYVGCNMAFKDPDGAGPLPAKRRSFAYTYNADATDEDGVSLGYGTTPPAFGIDFFRGPKDSAGNELPMSTFMFFTNAGTRNVDNDPENAVELYRYVRGLWADGNPLTYGGNGRVPGNPVCHFAYPGDTDPDGRPTWNETGTSGDRRMIQSAGPFTLMPGAKNEVILGAVWARANSGNNTASIATLIAADDKAQTLFDNNFRLPNGPDMPVVNVVPLDKKVIIALEQTEKTERYDELEIDQESLDIRQYKFQGYQIYQLATSSVSDFTDPSQAALIHQVDIRDSITTIINKEIDAATGNVNARLMVTGENEGIRHTFEVTADAFALGADKTIINNKTYYFAVVPYSYAQATSTSMTNYLPSRQSNVVFTIIPNKPLINNYNNNKIATGVEMTRIEGTGNGGLFVDLKPESINDIVRNNVQGQLTYQRDATPVQIKIYDPQIVPNKDFKLVFDNDFKRYTLYEITGSGEVEIMKSDTTYNETTTLNENEQAAEIRVQNGALISRTPLGFSIMVNNTVRQVVEEPMHNQNAFIGATVTYSDPTKVWLAPISDAEAGWIADDMALDTFRYFQNVLNGTYAPYKFANLDPKNSPLFDAQSKAIPRNSPFDSTRSVDLIYTTDQSKWSECVVVESGDHSSETNIGAARRLNLRKSDIGKGMGRGVFPGYALDPETGERLNVFFAEASSLPDENGADMLFNPTDNRAVNVRGGRHYVYIARTRYDSCKVIWNDLSRNGTNFDNPDINKKRSTFGHTDWISIPVTAAHRDPLETDVHLKFRVVKRYNRQVVDGSNAGVPVYTFSTEGVVQSYSGDNSETNNNALDLIRIVPNPYYANAAGYETSTNDFKARFTNLPTNATIHIYTMNGTLVRKFVKSDPALNYLDWDLQNSDRIPIASGMYIIHIAAYGYGEKTLKWLAVMRPLDFENF